MIGSKLTVSQHNKALMMHLLMVIVLHSVFLALKVRLQELLAQEWHGETMTIQASFGQICFG